MPEDFIDLYFFNKINEIHNSNSNIASLKHSSLLITKQKKIFLDYKFRNPNLVYNKVFSRKKYIKSLFKGKTRLQQYNHNSKNLKEHYLKLINLKISFAKLYNHTYQINKIITKSISNHNKLIENLKGFQEQNKKLFGLPKKKYYYYSFKEVRKDLKKFSKRSKELESETHKLEHMLPEFNPKNNKISHPISESFSKFKSKVISDYDAYLKVADSKIKFTSRELKDALQKVLKLLKLQGWEVLIDQENSIKNLRINKVRKLIIIPESRIVSRSRLKYLIVHEILTHLVRQRNGEKSKLKLLSVGLAHYERGEEGIATFRGQLLQKSFKNYNGYLLYFFISLALGLDGNKRDFRDIFELAKQYYYCKYLASKYSNDEALKKAQDKAWDLCIRIFRGTDYNTPGYCYTKDIVYLEGNIRIWKLLEKNPEAIKTFDTGKFDPANEEHVTALKELEIL